MIGNTDLSNTYMPYVHMYGSSYGGQLNVFSCHANPSKTSKRDPDDISFKVKCKKTGLPCIWCTYSSCANRYQEEPYITPNDIKHTIKNGE